MITGFHTIVYSDDANATRVFFRDVLGWKWFDAGDDWLMCDDITATVSDLRAKGVRVDDEILDEGFGLTARFEVPGMGSMMLYQPRHEVAYDLE